MANQHGLSTDGVIALSDAELVDQTYAFISKVSEIDENLSDALYFLVQEASERFAPHAERANLARIWDDTDELTSSLEGMRRREAARMIRDALPGDDDA